MDQETWNTLFSWLTGRQCFLLEGCDPPIVGILFYAGVLIMIGLMTGLALKYNEEIENWWENWRR